MVVKRFFFIIIFKKRYIIMRPYVEEKALYIEREGEEIILSGCWNGFGF